MEPYEIIRPLGKGAFGETFLIRGVETGKLSAMKRLPKENNDLEMVKSEIDILSHLEKKCKKHVLCYELAIDDEEDNSYKIFTEYLEGYIPLDEYINNTPDEERWQALPTIRRNLVDGMEDIHSLDVAHRDIKPSNTLINPKTLQTKIIDFGVSCLKNQCATDKSLAGTPIYMDPQVNFKLPKIEVPLNLNTYKKFDIWSLGVTLIEYILGERRFYQALTKQIKPQDMFTLIPNSFKNHYPKTMRILHHMLTTNPQYRSVYD